MVKRQSKENQLKYKIMRKSKIEARMSDCEELDKAFSISKESVDNYIKTFEQVESLSLPDQKFMENLFQEILCGIRVVKIAMSSYRVGEITVDEVMLIIDKFSKLVESQEKSLRILIEKRDINNDRKVSD